MKQGLIRKKFVSRPTKADFVNGFTNRYFSEEPFFATFSVQFDLNSPLLNPASNRRLESAERFFLNLDDDERAGYVVELRRRLIDLSTDYQYYLQSISGINTFYSKKIGGDEIEIEIKTLESLDLKITKIKELFNRVSYDYRNHRELLPSNLCWLNLRIIVADGRKIASWINNEFVDITPSLDVISYKLVNTKMITDGGHLFLDEVNNSELDMASNSITFKGGHVEFEDGRFALNKLLNNDIEIINSVNPNNKNSNIDVQLVKGDNPTNIEDKTIFSKISDRLQKEKNLLQQGLGGLQEKLNIDDIKSKLIDKAGDVALDITNGIIRDIKDEMSNKVLDVARQSGITNASGVVVQAVDGASFYDMLKNSIKNGDIELEPNTGLSRKILFGESLTFEEKAELYSSILKKALNL